MSLWLDHILILPLNTLSRLNPRHTVLTKLLDSRLQCARIERKVIDGPEPHDGCTWKPTRDSIHQRTARLAEVAIHLIPTRYTVLALILCEVGLTTDVLQGGIFLDSADCQS